MPLNWKTNISIFINFRYLRLKLLKNKENNKKICHIFHHNFKNIPCYVMSEVSLKRFYFALFDDGLTLKTFEIGVYWFLNSNSSYIHFVKLDINCCLDSVLRKITYIGFIWEIPSKSFSFRAVCKHKRTGRVSFRGGWSLLASCPNIFAIPCTKIKWFCPNITQFFARKWLFENF